MLEKASLRFFHTAILVQEATSFGFVPYLEDSYNIYLIFFQIIPYSIGVFVKLLFCVLNFDRQVFKHSWLTVESP